MRRFLYTLLIFFSTISCGFSQDYFRLTDTTFNVGQIYRTDLVFGLSNPIIVETKKVLDSIVGFLKMHPNVKLKIETNMSGSTNNSVIKRLCEFRAKNIYIYLVGSQIDSTRLTVTGNGGNKPIIVSEQIHIDFPFLPLNAELTSDFIKTLSPDEMRIAIRLNNRTEFIIESI